MTVGRKQFLSPLYVSTAKLYAEDSWWELGSHAEAQRLCWRWRRWRKYVGMFQLLFKIQNLYCVLSRFVAMAGSGSPPKEIVTGAAEGEGTPQKEVVPVAADGEGTPQREVITVAGEGELEKRSPSPMTPDDNVEEAMVSEPAAKRLKLEMEISSLATKVDQACESMKRPLYGHDSVMRPLLQRMQRVALWTPSYGIAGLDQQGADCSHGDVRGYVAKHQLGKSVEAAGAKQIIASKPLVWPLATKSWQQTRRSESFPGLRGSSTKASSSNYKPLRQRLKLWGLEVQFLPKDKEKVKLRCPLSGRSR